MVPQRQVQRQSKTSVKKESPLIPLWVRWLIVVFVVVGAIVGLVLSILFPSLATIVIAPSFTAIGMLLALLQTAPTLFPEKKPAEEVIEQRANRAFRALEKVQQQLTLRICCDLVHVGEKRRGIPDRRQRKTLRELCRDPQDEHEYASIKNVVEMLLSPQAGLLNENSDLQEQESTLELAPAILEKWQLLQRKLDEQRDFLLWYQKIEQLFQAWEATRHDDDMLLRVRPLHEAEGWLAQPPFALHRSILHFIEKSQHYQQQARQARQRDLARQLAVRSEFVRATASQYQPHQTDLMRAHQQQQLELSLLLAIESVQRYHARDTDLALRHALTEHGTILASLPHMENVQRVMLSVDGRYLAATSQKVIYLWKRAGNGTMQTFANFSHAGPGSASTIHTLAFSPDALYLVTASGNTVYVWDVESRGEEVIALEEHQRRVKFVAFSHESRFLVTAGDDALVKVWRWKERQGEQVEHWDLPHERGVAALALSPDGRTLATAAGDHICRLWDMMEQRLQRELPAHGATIRALAFRPDGRALATASWDETAMVWDTASGERLLRKPLYHDGPVSALAFSPNGSYLATACKEEALLWNARQGTLRTRLQHQEKVSTVVFSHDSHFLLTASDDQAVRVWETYTGDQVTRFAHQKPINTLALAQSVLATSEDSAVVRLWQVSRGDQYVCLLHNETINHLAFAPSGQLLATICNDDIARVWSLSSGKIRLHIEHDGTVNTVAWSADGRYIATGGDDGKVSIWDTRQEREQWCLQYEQSVHLVAFGPEQEHYVLAIASDDHTAQLVELREGNDPSSHLLPHGERVNAVAFSPDGQRLATVSDDGAAQLWDVVSGQRLFEPLHHEGTALTVAFSPSGGRFLATGSGHMDVQCWDAVNGQQQPLSYQHCEDFVNTLAFSQDGRYLAVGTKGETGGVYDVSETGQIKLRFSFQFEVSARALVFCPSDGTNPADGCYLATAEEDGLVTIWETASGRQLAWPGHTGSRYPSEINTLAFSPNGRYLAIGGSDGTAALWLWRPEDLVSAASTRLTRDLTTEEWKRHLGDEPYRGTRAIS